VHGIKNEISLNKKKVWWLFLGGRQTIIHKLILFNYTSCGEMFKEKNSEGLPIWNIKLRNEQKNN